MRVTKLAIEWAKRQPFHAFCDARSKGEPVTREMLDDQLEKVVFEAARLVEKERKTPRGVPSELWRLESAVLELDAVQEAFEG